MYTRLEQIYDDMNTKLNIFRQELDQMKNKVYDKKDNKSEGFNLKTAQEFLYHTNVRLSNYGYSMYCENAQKRNNILKEAMLYYGNEPVEHKLLALICVWSDIVINNPKNAKYHELLQRLQVDYAAIKPLL